MIISKFLSDWVYSCLKDNAKQRILYCQDDRIIYYFQFDSIIEGNDFSMAMEVNEIGKEGIVMQLPSDSSFVIEMIAEFLKYIPSRKMVEISKEEYDKLYDIWECSVK